MKKIAVIGLGSIGKRHLANVKALYPGSNVLAVSSSGFLSDLVIENADATGVKVQDAIDFNPDFAIVASPATYHLQHAKPLLAANIPVLIEKPITGSSHEARELVSLANQANIQASPAYCLRYLPSTQIVKKLIEQNKIGCIYNVNVHVGQHLPTWRQDKHYYSSVSATAKLGGGVLLELSHELDYLQLLFDDLQFKHAILRNTKELELEVEEIADVVLVTKSGTLCTVHMNFIQKCTQRYCYFIGEKGHIYWDLLKNSVSLFSDKGEEVIFHDPFWAKNNMYLLMIEEFVQRIKKQDKNNELLIQAQRTVELIDMIKSNATWGVKQ